MKEVPDVCKHHNSHAWARMIIAINQARECFRVEGKPNSTTDALRVHRIDLQRRRWARR